VPERELDAQNKAQLLQAYADIAIALAREWQQSGSDLLMRE
jgi:hypothetical protein